MRKRLYLISLTLFIFLLSGCADFKTMQKGVIENNQRVDTVLTNYDIHKPFGEEFKNSVTESIINQQTNTSKLSHFIDSNTDIIEDIELGVSKLSLSIQEYIEYHNDNIDSSIEDGIASNEEKIVDVEEFAKTSLTVHSFLNDKSGAVDQMFLVELPKGYTGGFVVQWLGGVIIDYKAVGVL